MFYTYVIDKHCIRMQNFKEREGLAMENFIGRVGFILEAY